VLLLFGYHFIITAMRDRRDLVRCPVPLHRAHLGDARGLPHLRGGARPADDRRRVVIVASGLYTLYRERKVAGQRPVATDHRPGMAPDGT
jgi:hypothetical protein